MYLTPCYDPVPYFIVTSSEGLELAICDHVLIHFASFFKVKLLSIYIYFSVRVQHLIEVVTKCDG